MYIIQRRIFFRVITTSGGGSSFVLTNGNGTTANGTAVDLGGDQTGDVNINNAGFDVNWFGDGGAFNTTDGLSYWDNLSFQALVGAYFGTTESYLEADTNIDLVGFEDANLTAQQGNVNLDSSNGDVNLNGLIIKLNTAVEVRPSTNNDNEAPLLVKPQVDDPLTPSNGGIWYNNTFGFSLRNLGITKRLSLLSPFITPEDYGAVGDGSTNDQSALQLAVNASTSGRPCIIGTKNYRTNTAVNVPPYSCILGGGRNSIISTTSNINIFNLTHGSDGNFSVIENITFLGNSAGAAQTGIRAVGVLFTTLVYGVRVNNCNFLNLNFAGIYSENNVSTSTTNKGGFYGTGNYFEGCGTGIYMADRAEYNKFLNTTVVSCSNGIYNIGGNNQYLGGSITHCTVYAFRIQNGSNDGKFSVVGFSINHNPTAVLIQQISNGGIFSACSILASTVCPIHIVLATGIFFYNCDIAGAGSIILNQNVAPYGFKNCRWVQAPAFTYTPGAAAIFDGCFPSVLSPAALSANTNDYAPSGIEVCTTLRISASSAVDLTGIAMGGGMSTERRLTLINIGTTNTITLKNDVTSTAANRFLLSADFALAANMQVILQYDLTSARWRKVY